MEYTMLKRIKRLLKRAGQLLLPVKVILGISAGNIGAGRTAVTRHGQRFSWCKKLPRYMKKHETKQIACPINCFVNKR